MGKTKSIKKIVDKKKNSARKALYKILWTDGSHSWEKVDDLIDIYDELVEFQLNRAKQKKQGWVVNNEPTKKKVYKMCDRVNQKDNQQDYLQIEKRRTHEKLKIRQNLQSVRNQKKTNFECRKDIKNSKKSKYSIQQDREQQKQTKQKDKNQSDNALIIQQKLRKDRQQRKYSINQVNIEQEKKNRADIEIQEIDGDFVEYTENQKQILDHKFRNLLQEIGRKSSVPAVERQSVDRQNYDKSVQFGTGLTIINYLVPEQITQKVSQIIDNHISKDKQPHKNAQQQQSYCIASYDKFLNNNTDRLYDPSKKRIIKIYDIAKIDGVYKVYAEWEYLKISAMLEQQLNAKRFMWINRDIVKILSPLSLLQYYEQIYANVVTWMNKEQLQKNKQFEDQLNYIPVEPIITQQQQQQKHHTNKISNIPIQIEEQDNGPTISFD